MDLPAGLYRHGKSGIRIKVFRHGKTVHSETLKGDLSHRHVKAALARRKELEAAYILGVPSESGIVWVFRDAAQDYLNSFDAKHSSTLSSRDILRRRWVPCFGNLPVSAITTAMIKRELSNMRHLQKPDEALSNKTKKNILLPLRAVLDHCEMNPNPAAVIKIRKSQPPEIDRYLPDERDRLLSALSKTRASEPDQVVAYFALLFMALRPGELLGLQWSDWDGDNLRIERQITRRTQENSTKTSQRRKVFIPMWVRPLLLKLDTRFRRGHIFTQANGEPHKDTRVFDRAWKRAHFVTLIHYRRPYDCRHTRAAELLSADLPVAACAKQMGHSVQTFLQVYSEWIDEYSPREISFDTPRLGV